MDVIQSNSRATRYNEYARTIQRSWVSYKNRQIFRLLLLIVQSLHRIKSQEILKFLLPSEALFFKENSNMIPVIKFRLSGLSFPPRICFKISALSRKGSMKYLSGRQKIDATLPNVHGLLQTIGRVRYLSVIYQDLLSTELNDTSNDGSQNRAFDEMVATFGGRQNYWRFLDGQNLVRFSPTMDIASVVRKLLGQQLMCRCREHLERLTQPGSTDITCRTILTLLHKQNHNKCLKSYRKALNKTKPDRIDWTVSRHSNRTEQLRYMYTSISPSLQSYKSPPGDEEYVSKVSQMVNPELDIVNTENPDTIELYDWSQNLPNTLIVMEENE